MQFTWIVSCAFCNCSRCNLNCFRTSMPLDTFCITITACRSLEKLNAASAARVHICQNMQCLSYVISTKSMQFTWIVSCAFCNCSRCNLGRCRTNMPLANFCIMTPASYSLQKSLAASAARAAATIVTDGFEADCPTGCPTWSRASRRFVESGSVIWFVWGMLSNLTLLRGGDELKPSCFVADGSEIPVQNTVLVSLFHCTFCLLWHLYSIFYYVTRRGQLQVE